jgi:energy-coupling factor transporter ATP-binding protein EcfA2
MIESIILPARKRKTLFRSIQGKSTFKLGRITCFVGLNASGKSLMLRFAESAMREAIKANSAGEVQCKFPLIHGGEYKYKAKITELAPTIVYAPQQYGRFSNFDKFGNYERLMDLTYFRASEAECAAFYFEDFIKKNQQALRNPCTLLLDEPENSNDPYTIQYLMTAIKTWTDANPSMQVLIATHSLFVLKHADVVHEMSPNYVQQLKDEYRKLL